MSVGGLCRGSEQFHIPPWIINLYYSVLKQSNGERASPANKKSSRLLVDIGSIVRGCHSLVNFLVDKAVILS